MLEKLKGFEAERHDLDELVVLLAFAMSLGSTYQALQLEEPEWLKDSRAAIEKEIKARTRDMLEKDLRETEARLEGLKTADEKRKDLREKAERLRAQLQK